MESSSLRPKDVALLLLASGDLLPRQRARDQQSDLHGNALKSRILNAIVVLDPDPEQLEATLAQIVEQLEPPTGPMRAVAVSVLEEWRAACVLPEFVEWLLAQAVHEGLEPPEGCRRGRKNRPTAESPDPGTA